METAILYIEAILGLYRGFIGIMEKKMENASQRLGYTYKI